MSWEDIATKEAAVALLEEEHADFIDASAWHGPGTYYIRIMKKRCPRGCCFDYTATLVSARMEQQQISKQMHELEDKLRIANEKVHENEGRIRKSAGSG